MSTTVSYFIPDPVGVEFEPWASVVAEQLANLGLSAPFPGQPWQDWADGLLGVVEVATMNVPSSAGFRTWQDWACRFVESMR